MSSVPNPVDRFRNSSDPLSAGIAFPITPSDSTDLTDTVTSGTGAGTVIIRWLIVGTGGNVAYKDPAGVGRTVALPAGGPWPIRAQRIMSTNTTASGLTGIY